jgi:glucoamylase
MRRSRRRQQAVPSARRHRRTNVLAMGLVVTLVVSLICGAEVYRYRSRHVVVPLLSAVVGISADGQRVAVPVGSSVRFFPGTRVIESHSVKSAALAAEQRRWLASGTIPGKGGPDQDMVSSALLDMHTLLLNNGALVAGWPSAWRYVWPRDAAFVAVALVTTGHDEDALRLLEYLQRLQPSSGIFQARYLPDGSGRVPDDRGVQLDGTGWVLWAAQRLIDVLPDAAKPAALERLRPLIDRSTAAALRVTSGPGALPPPSEDYQELPVDRLTLGTAAPIALGLRSAASLQQRLADPQLTAAAGRRAQELAATITKQFGPDGYPRFLDGDAPDAAVAFLLPPFTSGTDPQVVKAWQTAAAGMARPGGGLAPGVGWHNDGISWTPQTALFAWTAASIGDRQSAQQRLDWLDSHRTSYGSLPEKVLSDGSPAGPAPLTWTSAMTVLAVAALDG